MGKFMNNNVLILYFSLMLARFNNRQIIFFQCNLYKYYIDIITVFNMF